MDHAQRAFDQIRRMAYINQHREIAYYWEPDTNPVLTIQIAIDAATSDLRDEMERLRKDAERFVDDVANRLPEPDKWGSSMECLRRDIQEMVDQRRAKRGNDRHLD